MLPDQLTYGEAYGPVAEIETEAAASAYFEDLVERTMRTTGRDRVAAEAIQRQNIGYWSGYYDQDTAARINRLFGTTHPIFGDTQPTAGEAFAAGKALAGRSI